MSAALALRPLGQSLGLADVEAASQALADPAWLKERRLAAWAAWQRLAADPAASGTRFLEGLRQAFSFGVAASSPAPEAQALSLDSAWGPLSGLLRYGQGLEPQALLSPALKAQGVRVLTLRQALAEQPELVRRHLFSCTRPDETSLAALHAALLGPGALVHVPRGVKVAAPLRLEGLAGQAFFPHTLVVLEEAAELTVVDSVASQGGEAGLTSAVSELVLGAASRLHYIHHQGLNTKSAFSLRQRTALASSAYLYTLSLVSGGAVSSSHIESSLQQEGGSVDLLGLVLAKGDQQVEIRTLQDHAARNGASDALVKSILRGKARFYFDGVVKIAKAGQGSNAFQSNPNLLLSSDCRAESIPTLEIEADDVACKHAASLGSLDEEQKFYLLSRGISEQDAETAIVEGFAAEVAQRLPTGPLQDSFIEMLAGLARG
jgi:Fe-S cluster assembly protein SufD